MTQAALVYARFSSTEQAQGNSLERQFGFADKFAADNNLVVEDRISDEGKSAFHGKNRESGAALFEFEREAREGLHRGKVLLVENIDRLSRQGVKAATKLIWALNECGVDVVTWHDGKAYKADSDNDMIDLFSGAMAADLAYKEALKKSQRGKDNWRLKYEKIIAGGDTPTSRPPAWIRKNDEGYGLRPDRVRVLNEIYDKYIAGYGIIAIMQELNARGEPGWAIRRDKDTGELKPDKGWYQAYIHRLLTHRSVLGEYVTTDGRSLAADFFPQAITAEKFNQAQEVRATKKVSWSTDGQKTNNLLTGMVVCNSCGGTAAYYNKGQNTSATYVTKKGELRRYTGKKSERFCCDNRRRGKGCENPMTYDYQIVETCVLDALVDFVVEEDSNPALVQARRDIEEMERRIAVERGRLDNLIDALADGGSKALVARVTAMESSIEAMTQQRDAMQRALSRVETKPRADADVDLLSKLRQQINSDDLQVRNVARHQTNMALKRLVDSVTISEHDGFALVTRWGFWEWDSRGKLTKHDHFA